MAPVEREVMGVVAIIIVVVIVLGVGGDKAIGRAFEMVIGVDTF